MEPVLSLRFLENDVTVSYNCYIMNDDVMEITLNHDDILIGKIELNSEQLKSLISIINENKMREIEIDDMIFKSSFLTSLESLIS
jgi:hypothetical protein